MLTRACDEQLWDIMENKKLFEFNSPTNSDDFDELGHLAHMAALLGPPPKALLDKGKRTHLFYESGGLCIVLS